MGSAGYQYNPSKGRLTQLQGDRGPANDAQKQPAWFVDPMNVTGNANDANTGADAAHPVKSYNGGIVAKWGTVSPTLRQDTVITWLSSQPLGAGDPVVCTPIIVGANLILQGQLGPAQRLHAGVLGVVTPKNRATPQLLTADLGFAAPLGTMVHNTTAGKDSFAFVYKNVAGTVFALTQPLMSATVPFNFGTPNGEVDTWAAGDTFEIFKPTAVDLVKLTTTTAAFEPPAFPFPIQVFHLFCDTADGINADENFELGNGGAIIECTLNSVLFLREGTDDLPGIFSNVYASAGVICAPNSSNALLEWFAGAIITNPVINASLISFSLLSDVILDGTSVGGFAPIILNSAGIAFAENVYLAADNCGVLCQLNCDSAIIWGPGTLEAFGRARVFYTVARGAVATFINTGGLKLNGLGVANGFNPATGAWSGSTPLTPANLDAAFPGGFGGNAINPAGSAFQNTSFP